MGKFKLKYLFLLLSVIILSLIYFYFKPSIVTTEENWVTTNHPLGFSIKHPKGWKVSYTNGTILVEGDKGQTVIQPFFLPKGMTDIQLIASMAKSFMAVYPDFKIKGYKKYRDFPAQYILLTQYTRNNILQAGLFILSVGGNSGIFSGFAASQKDYHKVKDTLGKILESFKYYGPTAQSQGNVSYPQLSYQITADPKEGAFSVELPKGWQINAEIWRPYLDPWVKIDAVGKEASIFAKLPHAPIFFVPNYSTTGIYGLKEGSPIQPQGASIPGMVYRYLSAKEYVNIFLLPQLKGAKINSIQEKPDLANSMKDPYASTASAVELNLTIPSQNGSFLGKYLVCTSLITMQGVSVWTVGILGYHTYPNQESIAGQALSHLIETLKINPQWFAREQQQQAQRLQAQLASARKISNMIGRTSSSYPSKSTSSGSG
ncbi:MAG: hypothetical protein HYU63_08690, partial [Armatimonadetes bacterium]|nr:hypothetical protein [Armatimonadota bacterium]